LRFHEEEEEVGEEVTLVEGVTIGEAEGILEEDGEDLVAEVEEEGITVVVVAAEEETEGNTEVEEEEEISEGVGEVGHLVEVDTGKERDLPMVEEVTDMRAEVHPHQHHLSVGKEITIERNEEDLHPVMGLQEDHLPLPGIVMVHHGEIMGAPHLQGHQGDLMMVEDQAVEADMKTATPAEVLPHHPGTDIGAEVQWPAEIPHHMLVGQGPGKDIHQVQVIRARAEALELEVVIIEVVARVMEEEEVTKNMKEVREDIVEVVTNHPLEHLLERNTLNQEVKEGDMMTGEIEVPQDTIDK